MSNNLPTKLVYENTENNINNEDNGLNKTPSFINISNESSNPVMEPKSVEFYKYYSFFCIECEIVPDELNISTKGKISYICNKGTEDEKEHKDLSIKEIDNNLYDAKDID